jgi:hypothetical protein
MRGFHTGFGQNWTVCICLTYALSFIGNGYLKLGVYFSINHNRSWMITLWAHLRLKLVASLWRLPVNDDYEWFLVVCLTLPSAPPITLHTSHHCVTRDTPWTQLKLDEGIQSPALKGRENLWCWPSVAYISQGIIFPSHRDLYCESRLL